MMDGVRLCELNYVVVVVWLDVIVFCVCVLSLIVSLIVAWIISTVYTV